MKKKLNIIISYALVILAFSVPQKIKGMEDSLNYRDQKSSSFGLCHSEPGTNNALNQDISNIKYFHSLGNKYLNKGINFTIDHSTQALFLILSKGSVYIRAEMRLKAVSLA